MRQYWFSSTVGRGWDILPFLTTDTRLVVAVVNASVAVGMAVNLVYLVSDSRRLKALGNVATVAVGLVAMVRIWQVFPFDFGAGTVVWVLLFRIALGVAMAGSAIAIIVNVVGFVRSAPARTR